MLFGSFTFLILVGALCLALPRVKNPLWLLICFSLTFYSAYSFGYLLILISTTLVDFVAARTIEAMRGRRRVFALLLSLAANLGVLAFFKYAGFAATVANDVAGSFGLSPGFAGHDLPLPIGISFYTFQSIAYVVDVYRGQFPAIRRYDSYLLYVSFFPQILAGPIERAAHLFPQISNLHVRRFDWREAAPYLLRGIAKKFFVADNLAPYVDSVFRSPADASLLTLGFATFCFGIQIYCDFSGYTDLARGLARGLGVRLVPNFDRPYSATSVTDFWRRWHMSLSRWLRDYVYIPLGGNRAGTLATYRNLMVTMVLAGLWHGASYNFIIWGLVHGIALAGERAFRTLWPTVNVPRAAGWMLTMLVVFAGWYAFRVATPHDLLVPFHKIAAVDMGKHIAPTGAAMFALAFYGIGAFYDRWVTSRFDPGVKVEAFVTAAVAYFFMPAAYQTFIYFQF